MLKNNEDDELKELIISDVDLVKKQIDELENILLLSGPYDECDVILDIHPGAGGTESCDWALTQN